jgi:hypothetical protein
MTPRAMLRSNKKCPMCVTVGQPIAPFVRLHVFTSGCSAPLERLKRRPAAPYSLDSGGDRGLSIGSLVRVFRNSSTNTHGRSAAGVPNSAKQPRYADRRAIFPRPGFCTSFATVRFGAGHFVTQGADHRGGRAASAFRLKAAAAATIGAPGSP